MCLCNFQLDKTIAALKLEVVKSPEEYKTRLYNLEEQNKAKIEEREKMQETFLAKNELVKKYENILSFVQKQYEKFSEIRDIYGHLKYVLYLEVLWIIFTSFCINRLKNYIV